MSLTCYCDYGNPSWYYDAPDDYTKLTTNRRRRCSSCNELINVGDTCTIFTRQRHPETEIEIKIFGEDGEIDIAPMYHCEACADLYFNFQELGFTCVAPNENMRDLVREYQSEYIGNKS